MLFAIVPAAPPTRKNQRTTSCPAPISANVPYQRGSRLIFSALECVSIVSSFTSQQTWLAFRALNVQIVHQSPQSKTPGNPGRGNRSKIWTGEWKMGSLIRGQRPRLQHCSRDGPSPLANINFRAFSRRVSRRHAKRRFKNRGNPAITNTAEEGDHGDATM